MSDARPVAFLFTDLEGSTRRWESAREAMATALARHDALVRAAIEVHGGRVFKTVGDAFCAAFEGAPDALAAALTAQRSLAAEDWSAFGPDFASLRARMAVHTGIAEARDDDYFGPAVNRVARLLSAGHGGQILVSRVTEELAQHHVPAGATLRDLGEHRLKDLDRPERVFQLEGAGLSADFPSLRTLDRVPGNLPVQLTSFVGRAEVIAEVGALVAAHRLVTVTGIGGTGKTRLALQVAAECADAFPDGAWFVDLAPLSGDEAVAAAAASVVGAREDPSRPTEDAVAGYLRDRRALLILDNCEHVIGASARLAAALLRACPGVHILATSREPLAIDGETLAPLAPLETPALLIRAPSPAELARFAQLDAVQLFVERATAVLAAFRVDAANAPAIAEICHRLDGIPLAIELAAARVRSLAPAEIARRLDQRFRLLSGGHRDRLPRQQTLQAAIDWSYDLLPKVERGVLERFSVFACAVPVAAAEAVCAGGEVEDIDVLDAVDALVTKSLLVARDVHGESWYTMLDTIRVFSRERLRAGQGEGPARERQLDWYHALAEEAGIERYDAHSDAWVRRLSPLAVDCLASVRHGQVASDRDAVYRTFEQLWWLWLSVGSYHASHAMSTALLADVEARAASTGHQRLAWVAGTLALCVGRYEESARLGELAVQLARQQGDRRTEAWALSTVGGALISLEQLPEAATAMAEALEVMRGLDDPIDLAISIANFGELERALGHPTAAIARFREARATVEGLDVAHSWRATTHYNIALAHLELGQVAEAVVELREGLLVADQLREQGWCITAMGCAVVAAGDARRGAVLLGAGHAICEAAEYVFETHDARVRARHEAAGRVLLSPAEWDAALMEGLAMSLDEALAYALDGADPASEAADG